MPVTLERTAIQPRKLVGRVRTIAEITTNERAAMLRLMEEHYAHVTPERFATDLAEKEWVLEVLDEAGELRGFSTQRLISQTVDGQPILALFSGDTIVHRADWGHSALTQQWGRFALALMSEFAGTPLYWFLISKGYKTYRFLPVFFHEFYPRHDRDTPMEIRSLLAALGGFKFGNQFNAERGVVAAEAESCRLRPGVAELTAERLQDPHVRFFQSRNPGHDHGDELCCLAPLTPQNFTAAAYRVIGNPA